MLSKLPKCFISRLTHSWRMNQLFYNIFNPKENFFLEGFVCWRMSVHNRIMKHTCTIEFDYTNLLLLFCWDCCTIDLLSAFRGVISPCADMIPGHSTQKTSCTSFGLFTQFLVVVLHNNYKCINKLLCSQVFWSSWSCYVNKYLCSCHCILLKVTCEGEISHQYQLEYLLYWCLSLTIIVQNDY